MEVELAADEFWTIWSHSDSDWVVVDVREPEELEMGYLYGCPRKNVNKATTTYSDLRYASTRIPMLIIHHDLRQPHIVFRVPPEIDTIVQHFSSLSQKFVLSREVFINYDNSLYRQYPTHSLGNTSSLLHHAK